MLRICTLILAWLLVPGQLFAQGGSRIPDIDADELPRDWRWLTDVTIAGNEVWRVIALFLALLVGLIAGRLLRYSLTAAAPRFQARGRHLIAVALLALARAAVFACVVIGLKAGMEFLTLHAAVAAISASITSVLVTVAIGYATYCLVSVVDEWLQRISEKTASKLDDMLVPLVRKSLRSTIVILVLVQIATILSDKPVTSVIAGLGVGGLAVGLAAQDTIKNIFGSMMIFSDRPFEMGDEIIVDTQRGSVETVGFRSTRLRTGDGYLVTIPNGELANKVIVNVSKRGNLLRSFNLGLPYDLKPETLERAVVIVKEVLADRAEFRPGLPPRVFLNDLTASAANLSINYWFHPADWWKFAAFNEQVNLDILRRFRAEDIRLAYPTQSVHLAAEPGQNADQDDARTADDQQSS